ncbi:hypothetical protein GCM10028790_59410 [Micromonospora taraxaci]
MTFSRPTSGPTVLDEPISSSLSRPVKRFHDAVTRLAVCVMSSEPVVHLVRPTEVDGLGAVRVVAVGEGDVVDPDVLAAAYRDLVVLAVPVAGLTVGR